MTISTTASQTTQGGNGSTTLFYGSFPIVSASDVEVIYTNASGQQTTLTPSQYLVTIFPPVAGQLWSTSFTITYPLVGSPIASGTTLTISRVLPLTQTTSLSNQGAFYPNVVEEALDTNVMELQQVSARTGRIRGTWMTGVAYNFGDIVVDGINGNNTNNLYMAALSNTSSVWATDLAAGDWSLALNVQGIINTNPSIPNNSLFGNITGGSASPYGVSASAFIDSAFGSAQGDVLYRSATGWTALPHGASGQFLSSGGAAANPSWASAIGTGTVTSVATGTGLTGGTITASGTISLATIASHALLANSTGGTAAPSATTATAYLDAVFGSTQGLILYRGGSVWSALAVGSAGQALITGGAAANPSWGGPTAKAWCTFDGTVTGTNAPTAGYNVTSVTRNGTGDYTVTFTNAMADANYAVTAMSGGFTPSSNNGTFFGIHASTAPTTAAVRLALKQANTPTVPTDQPFCNVIIFGN